MNIYKNLSESHRCSDTGLHLRNKVLQYSVFERPHVVDPTTDYATVISRSCLLFYCAFWIKDVRPSPNVYVVDYFAGFSKSFSIKLFEKAYAMHDHCRTQAVANQSYSSPVCEIRFEKKNC